jgi:hypothetical protein
MECVTCSAPEICFVDFSADGAGKHLSPRKCLPCFVAEGMPEIMCVLVADGYSRVHVLWRGCEHTLSDARVLASPTRLRAEILDRAFGAMLRPVFASARFRMSARDELQKIIPELPPECVCEFLWR